MTTVKKFEIQQILGEGAFAKVFKDVWRGIPVAVKRILLSDVFNDARGEDALQRLDHPNVIKLYDVESDSTFRYYYLELCNASLDKLFLKDGNPKKYTGPMPSPVDVLHQLAVGLEYIHKMELVHRDIKPENVLIWLNPENNQVLIKWADFGFSKQVNERGSHSISGVNRGTDSWYAPEVLKIQIEEENGEDKTQRQRGTVKSDVFSEGLLFGYFLLDGIHLYGSRFQIQSNICENNPIYLQKIELQSARDLIQKMLATNPENRLTSPEVVQHLVIIKSNTSCTS